MAVRISAHPIFAQIAREFDRPLAAPSANRFGRISPTRARHVYEELVGRIPLIVDGGATEHGVESTIVAVRDRGLTILREGPIAREELAEFAEVQRAPAALSRPETPGQLPSHYAPRTPLRIVENISDVDGAAWESATARSFGAARRFRKRLSSRAG